MQIHRSLERRKIESQKKELITLAVELNYSPQLMRIATGNEIWYSSPGKLVMTMSREASIWPMRVATVVCHQLRPVASSAEPCRKEEQPLVN